MEIKLFCPKCKTDLKKKKDGTLHCPICKVNYQIIDGIPLFVDMDEFYEGKFIHVRDAEPELNNL